MSYYGPFNVDTLVTETQPRVFDDSIAVYDASAGGHRKFTLRDLRNLRSGIEFWDDCLSFANYANGSNVSGLSAVVTGTGAALNAGVAGETNHPGVIRAGTGTTTTGAAAIAGATASVLLGGGKAYFMGVFKTEANLSAVAQRYDIQVGFTDLNSGDATDGVYIRYSDDINSGKWEARAVSNGTETLLDSGTTVAADTWYALEVEVNADGTSAAFSLNGTSFGTITTNIPTAAGRNTGVAMGIFKSLGTTERSCFFDSWRLVLDFATVR
jgi:uncharacterized protein with putative carbohydrate binding module